MTTPTISNHPHLTDDPRARQFATAVDDKFQGLRDLIGHVATLLASYRANAAVAPAQEQALAELDQLQGGAEAIRQGILLLFENATHSGVPSPGTPAEDAEAVARQLSWEQIRADLEQRADPGDLWTAIERHAETAARAADPIVLEALRDQLPPYLAARGMKDLAPPATARVDEITAPHLPPLERAGTLARAALATGWPRVVAAFDLARAEIRREGRPAAALPGFGDDEQVAIG